jgi:hypothetical protein
MFNVDVERMSEKTDSRPGAIFISICNIVVFLINFYIVVAFEFYFLNCIY